MIRLFFIILFLFSSVPVSFAETIILGAENDWAPYSNHDGTGMANEIVLAAYKAVGIDVKFQVCPYNRLLKMVRNGEILGAFNVPRERSNEKKYIFGRTPLFTALSAYYYNVEKPLSATQKEELINGEKVGVVFDYGYGEFFSNNNRVTKIKVRSDLLNLRKLAKCRIDTTILYDKTAQKLIKENGLTGKILKTFDSETAEIYVAFSKVFPKGQYYAEKFDEGLAIIKANGIYKRVMDAY